MPQQTPLYIVASQHPRAGKTLLARLLIEYFRLSARALAAYDLDPREPSLARCFPELVSTVDIADTPGQMALFDRSIAENRRTTVIDLGYSQSERFFSVMAEIGFEREARRRLIEPIVLFITDPAPRTVQGYAQLRQRLGLTTFVPVHNEATSLAFMPQDFPPSRRDCSLLRLPRLSPIVRGVIDRPGFSFGPYLARQPGGPTEIHSWVAAIFAQIRELELRLIFGALESSLRNAGRGSPQQSRGADETRYR